ncbi:MAG: cell division ATP-binding protein FtsE [Thermoleophilia bacterium]|nr:cell division ATP-binding protein FtsE [Thermoleophilia bacterium]
MQVMSENPTPSETGSMRISGADASSRSMHRVGLKSPGSAMVVFDHVVKRYEESDHVSVGMEDVSLRIDKGEFVFVVGHSGSGKSTFIRLMLKELDPDSGKIMVGGRSLATLKRSKVPLLRRNIGCVFQDFKLLPNRTVFENIAYAMQVTGASKTEIRRRVPQIIHLVGLSEKVDRYPDELSGGEQQRVSIARAFINKPPLLIADEPTGNLDPETSLGIMDLLLRINREGGTTVIVATHDTGIVDRLRKRVIQLEGGRLIRDQARGGYEDTVAQEIGLDRTGVSSTGQFPSVDAHVPGTTGVFPVIPPQGPGPQEH